MVRVLVVDADAERAAGVEAVIRFLDHEPILVDAPASLGTALSGGASALALVAATGDTVAARSLAYLQDQASDLPVFLLGSGIDMRARAASHGSNVLGALAFPLRQSQFSAALKQALNHNAERRDGDHGRGVRVPRLVGQSRALQRVHHLIQQVAKADATVLILGESGTGKEVVARNIHHNSRRRGKPFVPINCGAIPADLLESELFGHEKGAFTGAISARQGRFELAQGGTLFLDEIGDMSLQMQVKLLRVLQERTFERVGSNKTIEADVRIIAATHRNLEQRIAENEFREDLFYRLNVFPIETPSLRERAGDIPVLVEELVRRIEDEGRGSVRLMPSAMSALSQYDWPGNVRELANLVERLAILFPFGEVGVEELPEKFRASFDGGESCFGEDLPDPMPVAEPEPTAAGLADASAAPMSGPGSAVSGDGIDLKQYLADLEIQLIREALDDAGGVVAQAAKRLNLRRTTLVEKLRKYGLQRFDETSAD